MGLFESVMVERLRDNKPFDAAKTVKLVTDCIQAGKLFCDVLIGTGINSYKEGGRK